MRNSFQHKIIGLVVVSLGIAQAVTLVAILATTQRTVHANIESDLVVAEGVFERIFNARFVQLSESVQVLATDFGFKRAVATGDAATILSAVENHGERAGADLALIVNTSGDIIASTRAMNIESIPAWQSVIATVMRDDHLATTLGVGAAVYQLVAVPVNAPDRIAWLFMGFTVDHALAREFKHVAGLDVSFFEPAPAALRASSLAPAGQAGLQRAVAGLASIEHASMQDLSIGSDTYLTRFHVLDGTSGALVAVLQKSLSQELAPYRALARQLGALSLFVLVVAVTGGVRVARGITEPVRQLAAAAERIGEGSYENEISVSSRDEIGQLADTLNQMQGEIAERQRRIVHQAHHDSLTGLPNRWLANDRLAGAITRSRRTGKPFTVAMLDLSRFKQINDTLGHHIGDVALKEVARRIVTRVRRSDTVARLGGDDFLLILEGADIPAVRRFIDELRAVLTEPIVLDDMRVSIDFTVGIAAFPAHAETADDLIRRSEIAMYDAKSAHSRVVEYEAGRDEGHLRQLAIVSQLPAALASDQLSLHYQPKADIATGKVRDAEALIRWTHPEFGFIPPDEFISVIEQSGNISSLTNWVIERAARQLRDWDDRGLDIRVSINLSALDLRNNTLPQTIEQSLKRYGVPNSRLALEITESAVMLDPEASLNLLGRLRVAGFRLSIDDFGTGYSSLAQLKRLRVDELKIDKSFIMDLSEESGDAVIVRSTIDLAHSMGLKVVAEGIETAASWAALKRYGCETGQGYLISKPLDAVAFETWLNVTCGSECRFLVEAA